MGDTAAMSFTKQSAHHAAWKTLAAFAIVYFVWGSTFLAIRIGVREFPPLVMAAIRFLLAGAALCVWVVVRGEHWPSRREWIGASLLSIPMFVFDYGLLFWAEKRIPSGLAAVMLATIPAFMALSEILVLRTQQLTLRLAVALLVGVLGIAVLMGRSLSLGGASIDTAGALALIAASISWAVASTLTRKVPLPSSKVVSSGVQMLSGGIFLALAAALFGEFRGFDPLAISRVAWVSLLYLTVAGSIIAFTAYLWLIHHESPTKVGTYAYVNPVIAVILGYFFGGEGLGLRTMLGAGLVLISVFVIITTGSKKPALAAATEGPAKAAI
jgi:drug/metabolite transporter (DMT)-like permease